MEWSNFNHADSTCVPVHHVRINYKCRVIFSTLNTFQSTAINNSSLHIEIRSQDEHWAYYLDGCLPALDDDRLWIKGSLILIEVYGNGVQHIYHLWHFLDSASVCRQDNLIGENCWNKSRSIDFHMVHDYVDGFQILEVIILRIEHN